MERNLEKGKIYSVDHLPIFQQARRRFYQEQEAQKANDVQEVNAIDEHADDTTSELSEEYSFNHLLS